MATISFYNSPRYVTDTDSHTIFLAGPILGSWDWQEAANEYLTELSLNDTTDIHINVCNPRRPEFKSITDFDDAMFYGQVDWEHVHLNLAKNNGVTLFWLANKTVIIPNRNYCLTTLFELGEAIGISEHQTNNLVVGIEPGFTNEKYLKYTIELKSPDSIVLDDLKETCMAAFIKIKGLM